MTTLIIARHGNTFGPGDTPTRVGARTDIPLVEKGLAQGRAIGAYLKDQGLVPDVIYASPLKRAQQTTQAAIEALGGGHPIYTLDIFNEIDYGPDENKTEEAVIARIGAQAIADWNEKAIVPPGWLVDPQESIQNWKDFAAQICKYEDGEVILVVTSNGTARFAPHITGDFEGFSARHDIKLSTGALGIFECVEGAWQTKSWNIRP